MEFIQPEKRPTSSPDLIPVYLSVEEEKEQCPKKMWGMDFFSESFLF